MINAGTGSCDTVYCRHYNLCDRMIFMIKEQYKYAELTSKTNNYVIKILSVASVS